MSLLAVASVIWAVGSPDPRDGYFLLLMAACWIATGAVVGYLVWLRHHGDDCHDDLAAELRQAAAARAALDERIAELERRAAIEDNRARADTLLRDARAAIEGHPPQQRRASVRHIHHHHHDDED